MVVKDESFVKAGGRDTSGCVITDYGATGDSLCTASVQQAIDAAARKGGGTVIVPTGTWVVGTLFLKSGVTLHLAPGSKLKGSPKLEDYVPGPAGESDGTLRYRMIVIEEQHDVVITGGGTIDGNGMAFWDEPIQGGKWYRPRRPRVSRMIEVLHSSNITFDNIAIVDSPSWTVHLCMSDRVVLRSVRVDNHPYGPNTDGFDIEGCREVFVSDCALKCGDDAIIVKARRHGRSCERIMISNCSVESNCIGIGIGQETGASIRQVTVSNCIASRCHRMFAVGMWEGGVVEDVVVSGLVGDTLTPDDTALARPIQIEIKHHLRNEPLPCRLRNIHIDNVVAKTKGRIMLTAQDGMWLENVVLRNIRLDMVGLEDPEELSPADGMTGSNQYANRNVDARKKRAAIVVENARGLVLDGLYVDWPADGGSDLSYDGVWGRNVRDAFFDLPLLRGYGVEGRAVNLLDSTVTVRG